MLRRTFIISLLLLSAAVLTANQLYIGSQVPQMLLVKDMTKKSVNLREQYLTGDKPLVINFFSTTCIPCKKEIPEIQCLYEKYGSRVNMILISVDRGRPTAVQKEVSAFISAIGASITMPVYISGTDVAMDFGGSTIALPSTYIINREGIIKNVLSGYNEGNIKTIEALCAKPDKI